MQALTITACGAGGTNTGRHAYDGTCKNAQHLDVSGSDYEFIYYNSTLHMYAVPTYLPQSDQLQQTDPF